jgi:surface protein
MFSEAYDFNQDLSRWNVSSVTAVNYMFGGARRFDQDISNWEVGGIEIFNKMFLHAEAFNQDLSRWDVSRAVTTSTCFMAPCHLTRTSQSGKRVAS